MLGLPEGVVTSILFLQRPHCMMTLRVMQVRVEALSLRVRFLSFISVPRLSFFSGLVSLMAESMRLSSSSDSDSSICCCGPRNIINYYVMQISLKKLKVVKFHYNIL